MLSIKLKETKLGINKKKYNNKIIVTEKIKNGEEENIKI